MGETGKPISDRRAADVLIAQDGAIATSVSRSMYVSRRVNRYGQPVFRFEQSVDCDVVKDFYSEDFTATDWVLDDPTKGGER